MPPPPKRAAKRPRRRLPDSILVSTAADVVTVTVEDDGPGFPRG
jgi:hypothetical protein